MTKLRGVGLMLSAAIASAAIGASATPVLANPRLAAMVASAKASMVSNPDAAMRQAQAAGVVASKLNGSDRALGLATAAWLQGEAQLQKHHPEQAEPLLVEANGYLSRTGRLTSLQGDLLVARGWQASQLGRTAQALGYYQAAHRIFLRVHDDRARSRALIAIGAIYDAAYDHAAALRYYQQALEAYPGDRVIAYAIHGNMGQALKEEHKLPEAAEHTRHALALARLIGSPPMIAHMLDNLARIQLMQRDLRSADREIAEAEQLGGLDEDGRASLLATAAQAALQHGRLAEATDLIGRSFDGVDLDHTPLTMRERHQTAYEIYERDGDSAGALAHLAAVKRLDDEATRLATSTSAALMGARFDFANQELRIAKLKADEAAQTLAFERARTHTQALIVAGVGVAAALLVAALAFALAVQRRSRIRIARANVTLGETNEALGRALEARTAFLATTSHEIRTPLNGILGMTQVMLADAALDPAVRDRLGVVQAAGVTMRALVDDILDVAKMETGEVTIEMAPVELAVTLRDLARLWEEQARARGLSFTADLSACPGRIEGDAARLRQIVFNLLANAIKFTDAGGITLRAWADGDASLYHVAVGDSGVGIPADKLEKIFEAFQQADTSTTRRYGGTGLGLAICRRLARAMGGDVSVDSRPGEGATFTLTLPLVAAKAAMDEPAAPGVLACESVVVVERNPIARATLKTLLEPRFARLIPASTLDEGVQALRAGGVGCVLADDATLRAAGPLTDGMGALARALGPDGRIALLWSPAGDESRGALIDAGATRVVERPVAKSELVDAAFGNLDYSPGSLVQRAA